MEYDVDGELVDLIKCEECGAMKVRGKKCICTKE